MPAELLSITERAKEFLQKSGHVFPRLEKSSFDKDSKQWRLVFDVGLAQKALKTVIIDDSSGKVLSIE